MRFTKKDFLNATNNTIQIDEWISVEENDLLHHSQVKSIPEVHVTGTLQFDGTALVFSDLDLDGVMTVLDSITMEDLEVAFDTKSQETYSFEPLQNIDGTALVFSDLDLDGVMTVLDSITMEDLEVAFDTKSQETYSFEPLQNIENSDEEIIVVKKDTIDLNPEIFQAILYEAPMSITRLPRDQYPKGNGWQLLSDQDQEEPKIDPRWEKLNDFKLDDD